MKKIVSCALVVSLLSVAPTYCPPKETTLLLFRMKNVLLVRAVAESNVPQALALLQLPGINTATKDAQGKTALHYAAEKGLIDVVTALLAKGADKSITDNQGETASSLAQKAGHDDIALLTQP
jgi:ankyrin repeat protein